MWVGSGVGAQVDPGDRLPRAAEQSPRDVALPRRQRVHAAPVVGIGVDIEQDGRRERGADRVDRLAVAPLADVGDSQQ